MKYLKHFKKLLALAAFAAMLTFLPNANVLTVSAAEPTTFCFMYIEDENDSCWRYQVGSKWDDENACSLIKDLPGDIKDGDVAIVYNGSGTPLVINVHLSNLTILNSTDYLAVVSVTGGIDNCFLNDGTSGAISGAVTNAYVYGDTLANFANNVGNLYTYQYYPETGPTVGVSGTVSYLLDEEYDGSRGDYGTNFMANSFYMEKGDLKTALEKYTQDISGDFVASASQPASTTAARSTTSSASDEYDAVPKTGETSYVLWLCLAAAASLSGSLLLRRAAK